jgi:hypothetical protein
MTLLCIREKKPLSSFLSLLCKQNNELDFYISAEMYFFSPKKIKGVSCRQTTVTLCLSVSRLPPRVCMPAPSARAVSLPPHVRTSLTRCKVQIG